MTLIFFHPHREEYTGRERYYVSRFDRDTYQIVDSIENREICICSNYDGWEDGEQRANKIMKMLNEGNENSLQ